MLEATNLTYERHFAPVFAPLNLVVTGGEAVVITGANGSGKTTLLRLLAGLLEAPADAAVERPAELVFVGHAAGIKDDLSVIENLRFMHDSGAAGAFDVAPVLAALGLSGLGHRPVRTLSAGQRRRCSLGRLLVHPGRLWLLDEPYANLDADGVATVDALLAAHLDSGGACVMSTHGSHRPAVPGVRELALQGGQAR